MFSEESFEQRQKLAYACRILEAHGHNDIIYGHVSSRLPGEETYWIKPSGLGLNEIMPETLIRIDLDGKVVDGSLPRHIEFPIHSEIFRARPEITCVIHTHPRHCVAFAAAGLPFRVISQDSALFAPDVPRFTVTSNLIMKREQGEAIVQTMGDSSACFLVYHGIVVVGRTIEEAVVRAISLEMACQVQLLAASANPSFQGATVEEAQAKIANYPHNAFLQMWNYFCRQVGPI